MVRRQYPFHLIEPKWQTSWDAEQAFRVWNPGERLPEGNPFGRRHGLEGRTATVDALPPRFHIVGRVPHPSDEVPSGGHPVGYTAMDSLARYRRARGWNVLHAMGWDAFGLRGERDRSRAGQPACTTAEANLATLKRRMRRLGFSLDWTREVDPTDPAVSSWRMSKSRGNEVNLEDIVREYGADAFRLQELFLGPLRQATTWTRQGVEGGSRFLGKVWRLLVDEASETEFEQACAVTEGSGQAALLETIRLGATVRPVPATAAQTRALHTCIRKVTEGLEGRRFHTAIPALMVFIHEASVWDVRPIAVICPFLQLLAPFCPHLAEELWHKVHAQDGRAAPSLTYAAWPAADPALLEEDIWEIPVQVNGRLRDVIRAPAGADAATLETRARSSEKVRLFLEGKTVRRVVVVPGTLVNLVVG